MNFMERICEISALEHTTNETISKHVKAKETIIDDNKKRQVTGRPREK